MLWKQHLRDGNNINQKTYNRKSNDKEDWIFNCLNLWIIVKDKSAKLTLLCLLCQHCLLTMKLNSPLGLELRIEFLLSCFNILINMVIWQLYGEAAKIKLITFDSYK